MSCDGCKRKIYDTSTDRDDLHVNKVLALAFCFKHIIETFLSYLLSPLLVTIRIIIASASAFSGPIDRTFPYDMSMLQPY